jgi:MFS-type transporter involved in bile tolerance (Atg22 family)
MRLLRPIPLSAIALLYASVVAIWGFSQTAVNVSLFCSGEPARGANIGHGEAIALFAGIGGAILLAFVRNHRRLAVGVLLLALAALGLAIAFVAFDSATYVQQNSTCGFSSGSGTVTAHVSGIYYAWGFAIALLVLQLARVLMQGPPGPPRSKYEQPGWLQEPPAGRQ